jgi:4-amino-4-deoxy-L-arabinose transferase-like glycosyltransferase
MVISITKLLPIQKYFFVIILGLTIFFSFWKLGSHDLSEWDEAEYGTIAFEMMQNGDYVNYYYAGEQDTRNGKPPLMIWSIILCYKLFGFNAFALRLTSAIATIFFFIFAFNIIERYRGKLYAFLSCLILLSCKAIVGFHVGRTGDTDALLICLLTASVYFFLLFLDFGKQNAAFLSATFLGLAFYTKGPAAFVMIPGMLLYVIVSGRWKKIIRDSKIWLSILIVILITLSWVFLLLKKGNEFNADSSWYGSHNALETLFSHDTFARLTDSKFEPDRKPDRLFFFSVLDIRFNIWNYVFYLSLFLGILSLFRYKKSAFSMIGAEENRLRLLACCMILPLSLLLNFAATKHDWYIAPIALFISILIAEGSIYLIQRYNWTSLIWLVILIFNLGRQFMYVNSPKKDMSSFFLKNKKTIDSAKTVKVYDFPTQDFFLYLNWHFGNVEMSQGQLISYTKNDVIIFDSTKSDLSQFPNSILVDCNKKYCIASIN